MCADQTTCIPEGHLRLGETVLRWIQFVGEVRVVECGNGNGLRRLQELLLLVLCRDLPRDLWLLLGLAGSSRARLLRGLDEVGNTRQESAVVRIILLLPLLRPLLFCRFLSAYMGVKDPPDS